MSTSEHCGVALLHSPSKSHLHGDPDDPPPSTCCICYQPLIWDTTIAEAEDPVQLACGHIFGTACIHTWAAFSTTCPICRAELDFQDACTSDLWQNQEENETYPPIVSQADADRYTDWHGGFTGLPVIPGQYEEDLWLALAYEEAHALCTSRKYRFSAYEEDAMESLCSRKRLKHVNLFPSDDYHAYSRNTEDRIFEELIDYHAEWMIYTHSTDDTQDDFAITYHDLFPC